MNRFSYTLLLRLLAPGLLAWVSLRARRSGGNGKTLVPERFGKYPKASTQVKPVWVHAVSLGETRAAHPLLRSLLDSGKQVLLTHMTVTGRAEGLRAYKDEIATGQLVQQWLPYDFPGAMARFLKYYDPSVGVLIEREIWPNMLAAAKRAQVPMLLVSARFSDNSLRKSLRLGKVMREAFGSFYAVYAQTLQDAQRLEQAGAQAPRVSGNFKFDVSLPQEQIDQGREFASYLDRKVIIIASTREGEDQLFINAIQHAINRAERQGKNLGESVLFCLVPRHPQRFDTAADLLEWASIPFIRRSYMAKQVDNNSALAASLCENQLVVLGDTLGEMPRYYAASQVAIVGGSFEPLGGQNFIEACAAGVPVIVGPHTRNFDQAVLDALDEGAVTRVSGAEEAIQQALSLLDDHQLLMRMSEAGRHWVQKHTGAVERVVKTINRLS